MYFLHKSSILNRKNHNFEFDGKKFLITQTTSLINTGLGKVIDIKADAYNTLNVFTAKSFGHANPKYQIVLECDLNKLPKNEWKNLVKVSLTF